MSEVARALLIIGAVAVALVAARGWASYQSWSRRRSIDTESLRPWPAVVVFTSTDCDACDPVRATVSGSTGAAREIKYQGNAEQFRSVGIDRVPAVVVIDGHGTPMAVFEGQVSSGQIARALRRV